MWLALASACGPAAFACEDDAQCANAAQPGFCEASGYCSFPADDCESGRKYGQFAPGELAGACVPMVDEATGSTTDAGTTVTSGGSSGNTTLPPSTGSSGTTSPTNTTMPADGPTTSGSDDSTTDDPTMDDPTTGGVSTPPTFVDEFERPDGEDIGNDWIEKDPDAFALSGGSVVSQGPTAGGYANHVVYRPFSESLLDIEVVMELEFSDAAPGHPQIHTRVQESDIGPPGSVSCYLLFIEDGSQLEITRQESGSFARRENVPIESPPNTTDRYRLRLRVEGTDPVVLDGYLERFSGDDWVQEAHVGFEDAEATRITDPGSFGVSGHTELDHYDYLRFTADAL